MFRQAPCLFAVSRPVLPVLLALLALPLAALGASPACEVRSGERLTPVIELYTSEGCSSCPPADQWLSTLKGKPVVAQAFHVGYWDYIGWVDRFATPANSSRQREMAATNGLRGIYTPQLVRNGRDWRDYARALDGNAPARATISLQRTDANDSFEARVSPASGVGSWSAYWTVTEHGHSSRVKAGENAGATLQHDFVVRQYTPVGRYQGSQTLRFVAIAAQAGHPRQINLVVSDPKTAEPLQAVSLQCS
ncbi:MAG: DUF1223 domain-containing protein [Rhodoferax sp.]